MYRLRLTVKKDQAKIEEVDNEPKTPYPNCIGNPTKAQCIALGYCGRKYGCAE